MEGFGPPWSSQPSLKVMAEDVGLNFDSFISQLGEGKTDQEIAVQEGISVRTVCQLREHFEKFGIDSIVGQD